MSDYLRTTSGVRLELLPDAVLEAIQRHLDTYNLGPILADVETCIETISEKKKRGLFKGVGNQRITSYAILTPAWLIYAVVGKKGVVSVLSVPLAEAQVEDHALTPFYEKLPDTGFHITGNFTGQVGMHGRQQVSIFLGLGEGRVARVFGEALLAAIAKTRR